MEGLGLMGYVVVAVCCWLWGFVIGRLAPVVPQEHEVRFRQRLFEWRVHWLQQQVSKAEQQIDELQQYQLKHFSSPT
jgi:hypothetical protein